MKNKELIIRLLNFPMEMEVCADMHHAYPNNKIVDVGLDDDKTKIWLTNYK